jgi:competence protein ComEA
LASAAPASLHAAADAGAPSDGGAGGGGAITADGKVILNLAGEEDLRRLPGIGASKAKAILELRAKIGRFRRAEDLLRVKGIGRRRLARLRPLLLIDPP